MSLRWRKDAGEKGLARICAGPRGHTLFKDGVEEVASVSAKRDGFQMQYSGWYWVARGDGIPLKNTCDKTCETEAEAKSQATEYVKKCLSDA